MINEKRTSDVMYASRRSLDNMMMPWPVEINVPMESPRKRRQRREEKDRRVSHQYRLMRMVGTQEMFAILSLYTSSVEDRRVELTVFNNVKSWVRMGESGQFNSRRDIFLSLLFNYKRGRGSIRLLFCLYLFLFIYICIY